MTRRRFISSAAWLAGAWTTSCNSISSKLVDGVSFAAGPLPVAPPESKWLVRGADLVNMRVTLLGARFTGSESKDDGWEVEVVGPAPLVRFTLPPQHVLESRYTRKETPPDLSTFEETWAQSSAVVVPLSHQTGKRTYLASDFLAMLATEPSVRAKSVDDDRGTRIEFPAGLVLTPFGPVTTWPNASVTDEFQREPVSGQVESFVSELWHATLRLDEPQWSWRQIIGN